MSGLGFVALGNVLTAVMCFLVVRPMIAGNASMRRSVTTTYLEMTSRGDLRPARPSTTPFQIARAEIPSPEFSRFLYTAVGARWWWYERLPWDSARWLGYLDRPELETWVAYVSGTPAGYFELEKQASGNVEIASFGLLPNFIGQGLGGALLTAAIERAWDSRATRVWLHTCDLDHPQALGNYQARGFRVYRTEEKVETLPDEMSKDARPGETRDSC